MPTGTSVAQGIVKSSAGLCRPLNEQHDCRCPGGGCKRRVLERIERQDANPPLAAGAVLGIECPGIERLAAFGEEHPEADRNQ